jgi:hypothetical protein
MEVHDRLDAVVYRRRRTDTVGILVVGVGSSQSLSLAGRPVTALAAHVKAGGEYR